MPTGYLVVNVSSAKGRILIGNASVRIFNEQGFERKVKSDALGRTPPVELEAPSIEVEYAKECVDTGCSLYSVEVEADGFIKGVYSHIQIFADSKSHLDAYLVPYESVHGEKKVASVVKDEEVVAKSSVYNEVYVPNYITIHLGRPSEDAKNVSVPFVDYVKNVACSEVYPSWPYEALRANIIAIISLALNRIYTSWYKIRGYNFQITNSTQFDQKYIEGRNIFDSISEIVDDTFNEYLRYRGNIEPLFSSYCDGRMVQCEGMTQWGSYDLANKGYNALEILQYFYGKNVEIVICNNMQDINDPYPGVALKLGDAGTDVYLMQISLNRISIDYPNISKISPANGIFMRRMELSVKEFQRQFNLEADGIIGKATWYKINYIYISVKKLAQIGSEGVRLPQADLLYPGKPLKEGSKGRNVEILQYYLNTIAQFYESIEAYFNDGYFGSSTKNNVVAFQKEFGLVQDGIVGEETWNDIVKVFKSVYDVIPAVNEVVAYPGVILKEGLKSDYTVFIQTYLNEISHYYPSISSVKVDGNFGPSTTNQVKAFQKEFGLKDDGAVGKQTWNKILEVYANVYQIVPYPNKTFSLGDKGNYVKLIQVYLNAISNIYNEIPSISVDGIYGQSTLRAVQAFQELFGLLPDGVVGKKTWNKIVEVYLNDVKKLGIDDDFSTIIDYLNERENTSNYYNIQDATGK